MARRFRNFRSNMVRSGRKTFWIGGTYVRQALGAAGTSVIVTSLNAAALALRPFTIVRTRGMVSIFSDQIAAVEDQVAAFGKIVVSDQAVAIGVTAVPTPASDDQSNWHVFTFLSDKFLFITGVGFQQIAMINHVIDSKAMRKVEEGQDLIGVVESDTLSDGCQISTYTRTLIKLH